MSSQGPYDPNVYDPANTATWPAPTSSTLYQPGYWWDVSTPGTMLGVPLVVGDRIYVYGRGRAFGDLDYGDQVFGGPPDRNWTVDVVTFVPWQSTLPPELTNPAPYSGCPLGDRWPGYRFVVDALYNADEASRTYGTGLYGDDVYGDANDAGRETWNDITEPAYSATITRGTDTGEFAVDVDQIVVDLYDPAGDWVDFAIPESYFRPAPGTTIRVGVFDDQLLYTPLAVGEIERIGDVHETTPRIVTVEAFGFQTDLVNTVINWAAPYGAAIQDTVSDLLAAASWRWGGPVQYPQPVGPVLLGGLEAAPVVARDELDRIAISAGWTVDTDRRGQLRFRPWPLQPDGPTVTVADCTESGEYVAVLGLVSDYDAMLNVAQAATVAGVTVEAIDQASVGRRGRRSQNFGFPLAGLYAQTADLQTILDRVVDELANVTVRLESIVVDARQQLDWVDVLLRLDTGQSIRTTRRGLPARLDLDGVVVGYEHVMSPNRWDATISTRTTTPTARTNP